MNQQECFRIARINLTHIQSPWFQFHLMLRRPSHCSHMVVTLDVTVSGPRNISTFQHINISTFNTTAPSLHYTHTHTHILTHVQECFHQNNCFQALGRFVINFNFLISLSYLWGQLRIGRESRLYHEGVPRLVFPSVRMNYDLMSTIV